QNWGRKVFNRQEEKSRVEHPGQLVTYRMSIGGLDPLNKLQRISPNDDRFPLLAEAALEDDGGLGTILGQVPIPSVAEKLHYYIQGWQTGHRPHMTLERVAELHPEVRV